MIHYVECLFRDPEGVVALGGAVSSNLPSSLFPLAFSELTKTLRRSFFS